MRRALSRRRPSYAPPAVVSPRQSPAALRRRYAGAMSDTAAARPRVLVSGASRGIGRAIALRMAADGHVVDAVGRSAEALARLADEALPGVVRGFSCDLTNPTETSRLVDAETSQGPLGRSCTAQRQ